MANLIFVGVVQLTRLLQQISNFVIVAETRMEIRLAQTPEFQFQIGQIIYNPGLRCLFKARENLKMAENLNAGILYVEMFHIVCIRSISYAAARVTSRCNLFVVFHLRAY
jgi:hypothetical protein